MGFPLGHVVGHKGYEVLVVGGFDEVDHFVHDDVFQTDGRFFY
jgi:hypothetical protein